MHIIEKIQKAILFTSANSTIHLLLSSIKIYILPGSMVALTDSKALYVGDITLDIHDISDIAYILLHEIGHLLLKHRQRGGKGKHKLKWNIATDIVIDRELVSFINTRMARESIMLLRYLAGKCFSDTASAEEIYECLENRDLSSWERVFGDDHIDSFDEQPILVQEGNKNFYKDGKLDVNALISLANSGEDNPYRRMLVKDKVNVR